MTVEQGLLIALGLILLLLVTQRWFWVLGLMLSGIACLFTVIACIVHFQILPALGFFILMFILFGAANSLAQEYEREQRREAQQHWDKS